MSENSEIDEEEPTLHIVLKRGRGRPRKSGIENTEIKLDEPTSNFPQRRRGKPRKSKMKMSENSEIKAAEPTLPMLPKRRRGRPRKSEAGIPKTSQLRRLILKKKRHAHREKPRKTCAVSTCYNSSNDPGNVFSFHAFPHDSRRFVWMHVAGITSASKSELYICSKHFKEEHFRSSDVLHQTAIPTLHLPSPERPLNDIIYDDLILNPSEITQKLHNTTEALTRFKKKHYNKYADLQTNLYLKHSSAYKLLEKPLKLSSPLELKKELYNSSIEFSRFSNLINKKILMMSDRDKVCFVTCVQIAVKPKLYYSSKSDKLIGLTISKARIADSVTILIAHGVNSDWHIPLDITFTNNFNYNQFTKNWFEQAIKTYNMLHVKCFVWFPKHVDYVNTVKLFTTLKFFRPDFNNLNCHILYDLQFLLKLLYFNLKTNKFYFGELNANLDDLKELYEIDSKRTYPLAPQLNASSINLSTFDQLTYKQIKEVFSEETAAALKSYTAAKLIKAEGTAVFVDNIAQFIKLFDSNDKLTGEEKESIIYKVKGFLKTIKRDQTNHFINNLSSVLDIYLKDPELFSKMSKYLLNNYAHTFVDNILDKCFDEKPSSMDIENAYRKSFIENLLKPIKRNVSFEETLNLVEKELNKNPLCFIKTNDHSNLNIKICEDKLYILEREDRLLYVAGYILKKCYLNHDKCNAFKNYIDNNTENEKLLSKSISKEIEKGICLILKNDFVEFIEVLEIYFLGQFLKLATKDSIIKNLLKSNEMQAIEFTSACLCFPSSYARALFVRIRVDYFLSYNNMYNDAKLQNISL